jgi:hypothetical protein
MKNEIVEYFKNKNLTAEQIMIKSGYNKIYDCGNLVFIKDRNFFNE